MKTLVLANKPVHFVLITAGFIMGSAKRVKPRFEFKQKQLSGPDNYRGFRVADTWPFSHGLGPPFSRKPLGFNFHN